MKQTIMRTLIRVSSILLVVGGLTITALGVDKAKPTQITIDTVIIGKQVWMAKNLDTDRFRNGDLIAEATNRAEWQTAKNEKKPVWGYYDFDPAYGDKYGKLYNWYAVANPRGLAPVGWHVPSDAEWRKLTDYLGGEAAAGPKLKSATGWKESSNFSGGSHFSGLPGGACADDGYMGSSGYLGVWWTATPDRSYCYDPDAYAWYRYLYYTSDTVGRQSHSKGNGFSVRCLKD